ncbi:hypothetical protein [Caulobacter soli]|uniref:hypothetical protein n=1 Tax=Caulobacter soli TaxID=2708539 RepID=UPI0013ECBEF5|nr:hypothetical protein [Caulobacter soli]
MSSSQHISDHLKAVRRIALETSPEDVAGTVALAIQRVKVTLQNLSLLANKTPAVAAAARNVDACLPTFVAGEWSGVFFGDALLSALDAFEAALDAAGPSEVAKRIGAWQVRPLASPATSTIVQLAS